MQNTSFVQASRMLVHFVRGSMFMSMFWHANTKEARFSSVYLLNTVNFTLANLHKTQIWDTYITDEQLKSALSIRDARLSSGILGRDPNRIKNGYADCNSPLNDSWILQTGSVIPTRTNESSNKCHFTLQSLDTGAIMLQRVNLSNIWNSYMWPYSHAVLNAQMGIGVSIQLSGINNIGKILDRHNSSRYKFTRHRSVHLLSDVQAQLKVTWLWNCMKQCKNSSFWSSSVHVPLQLISAAAGALTSNSSLTMAPSSSPYQVSLQTFFDRGCECEHDDMIVCCKQEDASNPPLSQSHKWLWRILQYTVNPLKRVQPLKNPCPRI